MLGAFGRNADLLLALGVAGIVALLVLPVPPVLMDALIATNISLAVLVLLVALYLNDAAKMPSFPTILLLATLFRLALNVGTTRLILLEGDAGSIITAFGQFVVGGDFIVGGVVFLVLVLVQFIVIAKGSERVAEVAARFTLDAMPGKQMAIDADIRSGLLDPAQGKARREEVGRESKLYGAMDGAMKFVKGDAIAGIVISLINVVGGLIIGTFRRGMSLGEAAEKYTLLTIGDGLVSQIPALLLSVAAGLVVTRVASGDGKSNLASDISEQVGAQPKAIGVTAGILLLLGLSGPWTGFPVVPFLLLAAVAGGVLLLPRLVKNPTAAALEARARALPELDGEVGRLPNEQPSNKPPTTLAEIPGATSISGPAAGAGDDDAAAVVRPLVLEFHPSLEPLLLPADDGRRDEVQRKLKVTRLALSDIFGVPFPPVLLRPGSPKLRQNGYAVLVHNAPVATGHVAPGEGLAWCDADFAKESGLESAAESPLPWAPAGGMVSRVARSDFDKARAASISVMPPEEVIVAHLRIALRRAAPQFMGVQQTSDLLERLKGPAGDLVKAVVPVLLTTQQVTEVFKRLLAEQVPIGDGRAALEALAKWGPQQKDPGELAELVRWEMRRALTAHFSASYGEFVFHPVSGEIEQALLDAQVNTPQGPVAALAPEDVWRLVKAVTERIDLRQTAFPVLVTSARTRRLLRSVLENDLPDVAVLSRSEVAPGVEQRPQATVQWIDPENDIIDGVDDLPPDVQAILDKLNIE